MMSNGITMSVQIDECGLHYEIFESALVARAPLARG